MLAPTIWTGSSNVPSRGWFIFGGYGNNLTNSQWFNQDTWKLGPSLYENSPNIYQCITQVIVFKAADFKAAIWYI